MAKEKQEKEKPLEKMTAKDLREMAMTLEGVSGVHGMNKEELVAAIRAAKGLQAEGPKKTKDVRGLKEKAKALKAKREAAKEAGNTKMAEAYRRRISNLKKKTRRA